MVKVIAFDFDGVIHSYVSGWKGTDVIPDLPVKGIKKVLEDLKAQKIMSLALYHLELLA